MKIFVFVIFLCLCKLNGACDFFQPWHEARHAARVSKLTEQLDNVKNLKEENNDLPDTYLRVILARPSRVNASSLPYS